MKVKDNSFFLYPPNCSALYKVFFTLQLLEPNPGIAPSICFIKMVCWMPLEATIKERQRREKKVSEKRKRRWCWQRPHSRKLRENCKKYCLVLTKAILLWAPNLWVILLSYHNPTPVLRGESCYSTVWWGRGWSEGSTQGSWGSEWEPEQPDFRACAPSALMLPLLLGAEL